MAIVSEELQIILTAQNKTTAAFNSMNKDLNSFRSTALHVAASLASAFAIRDVIRTTEDWAQSVSKIQQVTGLTTQQSSRLGVVAKAMGLDVDELSVSLDRLAKNLFSNSVEADKGKDAFSKWGIETRGAHGEIRNINDVLVDAAEKVRGFGNGAAATALEMDLFGRSGGKMHDLLMLGADGVKQLSEESDRLGLTLDRGGLGAIREFTIQSRILDAAMDGLKVRLGIALLPVLRDIVQWLTNLVARFSGSTETGRAFAGVVKALGEVLGKALGVLKDFAQWLGEIWSTLKGMLGSIGATELAANLLIIALAGIAGGPVLLAIAAVVLAFLEVKKTVEFIQQNWDTFVFALTTGRLNDIPFFGFFFRMAQEVIQAISDMTAFWMALNVAINTVIDSVKFFLGISKGTPGQPGGTGGGGSWNWNPNLGGAVGGAIGGAVLPGPGKAIGGILGQLLGSGQFQLAPGGFIDPGGAFFPGGQAGLGGGGVTITNNITVEGSVTTEDGLADRLASRVGNAIVGTSLTHGRGFDY